MIIDNLVLRNFRNYSDQKIELHPKTNIFYGANGSGKTNLLEAVRLLFGNESFRSHHNEEMIQKNSNILNARLEAEILQKDEKDKISITLSNSKKEYSLAEKRLSRLYIKTRFSSILFSPDSLSIVKQGPGLRRELIDDIMCSIHRDKLKLIDAYNRCLKTRNKILKDQLLGLLTRTEAESLILSLNASFLPLAVEYVQGRLQAIKKIQPIANLILKTLLKDENVDIFVEYVISSQSGIAWSQNQVYDALLKRMSELKQAEEKLGQTLIGPHKHEIQFKFKNEEARYYCSQGQQRAIILAFKIAQVLLYKEEHNESPILLLDDVFSEFDEERRKLLLKILVDMEAQIMLTTTEIEDPNLFEKKEKKLFEVKNGIVKTGSY
jgi:DNA replication and repair protein RecF